MTDKFKPKLRHEASINMQATFIRVFGESFPFQNCLNCLNFTEATEICKLYKQRPPARVISYGCDKFDDNDDIPF